MATLLDDSPGTEDQSPDPGERHYRKLTDHLSKSEGQSGFYHKDSPKTNAAPYKADLARSERIGSSGPNLYKSSSNNRGKKKSTFKNRFKAVAKNKWAIGGAIGAPIAVIALIALILIAGSLKLPNVMSEIEAYQFANVTSDFAQSSERTTEEALAVDATTSSTWKDLQDKFAGGLTDIKDSTWGRLDAYRPAKIIQNLNESGDFQLNYKTNLFGGKQWTGGVLNGTDYTVQEVDGIAKWIPGLKNVLQSKNAAVTRGQLISDVLQKEEVDSVGTIIKGKIFLNLLNATDGSLTGWALNKFTGSNGQGMTDQQALDEASLQTEQASEVGLTAADNAVTSEITQANAAYKAQLLQDESNPQTLQKIVANGGEDVAASAAAENALKSTLLTDTVSVINPLYSLFLPICIIYDGSVQNSGPPIANQINQQVDVFDKLAAEADQQKQGNLSTTDATALANAVNGTNAELGNISNSIPYQRASGQTYDTSSFLSPEAGSNGSYTYSLFNLVGISGGVASLLNRVLQPTCRGMTNPYVGLGLGIANIVGSILSFGQTDAYEQAASQSASQVVKAFANYLVDKMLSAEGSKEGAQIGATVVVDGTNLTRGIRALKLVAWDTTKKVATITGITLLANILVSERAGQANNGFAQGQTLINQADSGANISANELERTQLFGRPLTPSEVNNQVQNAAQLIAKTNASKSLYQRYFALSNPDSLLTHLGTTLGNYLSPKLLFSAFFKLCAGILHPTSLLSVILSLGENKAHATTQPANEVYGNIQFGWTNSEKSLINSNNSYFPLENDKILRDSGKESQIVSTYATCFGYTYNSGGNGDFDPTDPNGDLNPALSSLEPGSLATLITSGAIPRDNSGNVEESGGLCSPQNLGINNPTFGDLVFRWRLAMNYDTTLDTLTNLQAVN